MALVVKEDVAANPLNVGLFGTVGVVVRFVPTKVKAEMPETYVG